MTEAFQEVDTLLGGDYSDDYWSDDVVLTARELIEHFNAFDWLLMEGAWRSRPPQWQHRCADILSRVPDEKSIRILFHMAETNDSDLVMAAADSLSVMEADLSANSLTPKAASKLRELARQGPVNKLTVDQLMLKLKMQSELLPT